VSSAQSNSGANSIEIAGDSDLVHPMCSDDFGAWSYSAWQYIPSDFASGGGGALAGSWFILMDQYNDAGPVHGALQMQFNSNDGLLKVYDGVGSVANPGVPYETDRWVKIQTIVDLEADGGVGGLLTAPIRQQQEEIDRIHRAVERQIGVA
jgi:hypothetical protein